MKLVDFKDLAISAMEKREEVIKLVNVHFTYYVVANPIEILGRYDLDYYALENNASNPKLIKLDINSYDGMEVGSPKLHKESFEQFKEMLNVLNGDNTVQNQIKVFRVSTDLGFAISKSYVLLYNDINNNEDYDVSEVLSIMDARNDGKSYQHDVARVKLSNIKVSDLTVEDFIVLQKALMDK